MQRYDQPAATTFVRYHQPRAATLRLPDTGRLEMVGLFVLVCMFWGIILFVALSQSL